MQLTNGPSNQLYLGGRFLLVKHVASTTMSSDSNIITLPESSICDDIPMLQLFLNLEPKRNKQTFTTSFLFLLKLFMLECSQKRQQVHVPLLQKRNKQNTDLPLVHPHPKNGTVDRGHTGHTQTFPTTMISDHRTCLSWAASLWPRFGGLDGWMGFVEVWAYLHHPKVNEWLEVEHVLKRRCCNAIQTHFDFRY